MESERVDISAPSFHLNPSLVRAVFKGAGFVDTFKLSSEELRELKNIIQEHYLRRIEEEYPHLVQEFAQKGIEDYHLLSHLVDHNHLWPKQARLFNKVAAKKFRNFKFFHALENYLGKFEVIDYEGLGNEEFNWRLVRPNSPTDIGPMHKDSWFWNAINKESENNKERIKIWIPVVCEPGLSGLRVVPNTQFVDYPFRVVNNKPQIEVKDEELSIKLLETNPGDAVIFNYELLHGGSVSRGTKTRVSLELSLYVDKNLVQSLLENAQ
jgi:hypothetical protein